MESKFDLAVFEPRNIFDTFDIYIYIFGNRGARGNGAVTIPFSC